MPWKHLIEQKQNHWERNAFPLFPPCVTIMRVTWLSFSSDADILFMTFFLVLYPTLPSGPVWYSQPRSAACPPDQLLSMISLHVLPFLHQYRACDGCFPQTSVPDVSFLPGLQMTFPFCLSPEIPVDILDGFFKNCTSCLGNNNTWFHLLFICSYPFQSQSSGSPFKPIFS